MRGCTIEAVSGLAFTLTNRNRTIPCFNTTGHPIDIEMTAVWWWWKQGTGCSDIVRKFRLALQLPSRLREKMPNDRVGLARGYWTVADPASLTEVGSLHAPTLSLLNGASSLQSVEPLSPTSPVRHRKEGG